MILGLHIPKNYEYTPNNKMDTKTSMYCMGKYLNRTTVLPSVFISFEQIEIIAFDDG